MRGPKLLNAHRNGSYGAYIADGFDDLEVLDVLVPLGPGPAGHRLYAFPDIVGAGRQDPLSPVPAAGRNETKSRCSTLPGPKRPAAAPRGGAIPHPATSGKGRGAPGVLTRCQRTPRRVSKKPKPRSAGRGSFQPPRRDSPLLSRSCRSPCTAPAPPNPRSPCAGSPASRRGPAGRAPSSRPPPRRAPRSPWPARAGQSRRSAAAWEGAAPPPWADGGAAPSPEGPRPPARQGGLRRRAGGGSLASPHGARGGREGGGAGLGRRGVAGNGLASPPRRPPGSSPRGKRAARRQAAVRNRLGGEPRAEALLFSHLKVGPPRSPACKSGCGAAVPADGRSEAPRQGLGLRGGRRGARRPSGLGRHSAAWRNRLEGDGAVLAKGQRPLCRCNPNVMKIIIKKQSSASKEGVKLQWCAKNRIELNWE